MHFPTGPAAGPHPETQPFEVPGNELTEDTGMVYGAAHRLYRNQQPSVVTIYFIVARKEP